MSVAHKPLQSLLCRALAGRHFSVLGRDAPGVSTCKGGWGIRPAAALASALPGISRERRLALPQHNPLSGSPGGNLRRLGASTGILANAKAALLFKAIERADPVSVGELLDAGADPEAVEEDATALLAACYLGHADVAGVLIQKGANVDAVTNNGTFPLLVACQEGHAGVVSELIAAHADVHRERADGCSPILMACQQGHPAVVSALIAAGLQVDTRSFEGATPLFYAAQAGHPNVAAILLASGADPDAELPTGATPLLIACQMVATKPSH
jgi:hypothetical protein